MNKKIIDQVIIEGFQDFEQYMKINPINIEISDSEIQTKLRFSSKKIHKRNLKSNQDNEIKKKKKDLKNSIKNLFISTQTKKKTIDEYVQKNASFCLF